MAKFLKPLFLFTLICGSLCLEQIVTACGGGDDPYDYYYSFFHNNTAGSPAYMPFYFVTGYKYYEDWGNNNARDANDDANIKEWRSFAANRFTVNDAADFIYKYGYNQLSNLYYHIEQGKALQLPDSVRRNSMTRWFLEDKDLEALGYLMFAKKCEAYTSPASAWEAPKTDAKAMDNALKGGLQLWRAAKKDFFRWRYAYQALRLAFYSKNYTRTFDLYQELIGDKTDSSMIYYRCLSLKAGACYKTGDYNTAAYLYSLCFTATDDGKFNNYISYDWCFRTHGSRGTEPGASHNAVLNLARNNKEKAAIVVMDALHQYEDALALMNRAYQLDPEVRGLDVVMTREINKLEMNLLDPLLRSKTGFKNHLYTNYYYDYRGADGTATARQEQYRQNLQSLIAFGSKLTAEAKAGNTAFWPLSVAYLYFIKQDWKRCEEWLVQAARLQPQGKLKGMLELEQLLLAINKNPTLDAGTEARILPSLQWLEEQAIRDQHFSISYQNLMRSVLPNVYMQQRDTLKALLCIAKATTGPRGKGNYNYWYNPGQGGNTVYVDPGFSAELEQVTTAKIIAMKNWIDRPAKTPYEAFLVSNAPYAKGALDLYIGTRYLRQLDFASAAEVLKAVPQTVLNQYRFPDPFAERWIDTQEPRDTTTSSNKYLLARDLLHLQEQIDQDKADAAAIYKFANGLYSMTYYGLSWKAVMYYRSGSDRHAYYNGISRDQLLPGYRNYYSAEKAALYYQKALDKAQDPELKARCLFMLSKCWQKNMKTVNNNRYYYQADDEYYRYTAQSPYFKQLTENYGQTNIFKSLHEDCSYLRFYVRKAGKR